MIQNGELSKYAEKPLKPMSGWTMVFILILIIGVGIAFAVIGGITGLFFLTPLGVAVIVLSIMLLSGGFIVIKPNEAAVLVLFGKYYGSILKEGFYFKNPFAHTFNPASVNIKVLGFGGSGTPTGKLSLKAMTLDNNKQKVNDLDGNPIEIGVVVIWRIKDTAKAVFNVQNYAQYISTQSDAAIRQVARQYPYDVSDNGDEKSLRGSSQEIAEMLKIELQKRVDIAGIEIMDARISHLAYAPEIAAAMLQRQQAKAIIDARTKIVEGAVSMVQMALEKLSSEKIVELDDERKAQMVSNLLVVLCGNKEAQPVVNSGSLM